MSKSDNRAASLPKIELQLTEDLEHRLLVTICDVWIRLMWVFFIDPDMSVEERRQHFSRERRRVSAVVDEALNSFKDTIRNVFLLGLAASDLSEDKREKLVRFVEQILARQDGKERIPKFEKFRRVFSVPLQPDAEILRGLEMFSELGRRDDSGFVRFVASLADHIRGTKGGWAPGNDAQRAFAEAIAPYMLESLEDWKRRVEHLTPELVSGIHDVRVEFIEWLARHPDAMASVAWDAFEKIIAEILASNGFEVAITARTRNASADIIAIRRDKLGIETRYLVECKRYTDKRRVGLGIVNSVLGAKKRERADLAMLVTTSGFTRDVRTLKDRLSDLRLHLRDGEDVRQWLASYEPNDRGGLWLDTGWNLDQSTDHE